MPVRLKDIARDLGVSVVTVSKVLRNQGDISAATRQRVLKRMQELHYRPNLAARALITGRTHTVGLIVPDLLHPFFAQVAKALQDVLRPHGYGLLLSSSEEDPELERQELELLLGRRVDALLIASAQYTVEGFRQIEEQKIPYVLIDRCFAGLTANFVGVDDEAAGDLATAHLLEQGCRRIAHIRGPGLSTAVGRLEGYRRALARQELAPLAGHIVSIGSSADGRGEIGGYEAARTLLATTPRPDGIFCYNDPSALGAMRAILAAGLDIPRDIALVGCGNVIYSDFLRVPLSTIDQDSHSIGARSAELALELIAAIEAKTPLHPRSIFIPPRLIARASSLRQPEGAPPPAAKPLL
jgi:LacI family transcriptional regulator